VRILALSDTHGLLPNLDVSGVDCIMIAGDISPPETNIPFLQRSWLENEFCPWVEALDKPVYLTLGNHDFVDDFKGPKNLRYGTEAIFDGVLLFSWTSGFGNWAWMTSDYFLGDKLEDLLDCKTRPQIWLTHGPPMGTCDLTADGCHAGSESLYDAIMLHQPQVVICGHIHHSRGRGLLGKTEIHNVSISKDMPIPGKPFTFDGKPALIDITDGA